MNDQFPNLINTEPAAPKNGFPILIQLGIMTFVLFGMFGTWIWQKTVPQVVTQKVNENFIEDTNRYPITPQKIEQVSLVAEAAYVWDVKAQQALYSKNANEKLPLASITKLMTALLSKELISNQDTVTIPLSAIEQEGSSGLATGEQISVKKLRDFALIASSNDAAYALATNVGELLGDKDPEAQFVRAMNIKANELGLRTLEFKNTTGLDLSETQPGAVGSAREVSFLLEHIITNYPNIIAATKKVETRIYNEAGAYHEARNTNRAVQAIPNLIGSKTGFTDLAGGNLTIVFNAGLNRPIIVTVLGSTREGRFDDVLTLISKVKDSLAEEK